jgi:Arm DNA-binding domain
VKLTQPNAIRQPLPPGKSDAIFFDDDLPGFGLRVRAGGKRTWIIQYRVGAKQRRLTIGSLDKLSADQARKAARGRLACVELGGDPQQEKQDARNAAGHTVGRLVDDYLARRHHETGKDRLRRSSYEATELYLRKQWKPLHGLQASKVDRSAVASRLTAIEAEISSVTAARARVAFSSMFAWAIGQGIVDSNPVIGTNKPPEPKARDRVRRMPRSPKFGLPAGTTISAASSCCFCSPAPGVMKSATRPGARSTSIMTSSISRPIAPRMAGRMLCRSRRLLQTY